MKEHLCAFNMDMTGQCFICGSVNEEIRAMREKKELEHRQYVTDVCTTLRSERDAALEEVEILRHALTKMLHLCEHDLGMDEENPYIELAYKALKKE